MSTTLKERVHLYQRLASLGLDYEEASQLHRIAMTLRNWYEQECGNSNDHCSWAIERDDQTQKPYRVVHPHQGPPKPIRTAIADREKGALKRLAKLMASFPELTYYVQTDPRGCALYILKQSDVNGQQIDQIYSRGIAVY